MIPDIKFGMMEPFPYTKLNRAVSKGIECKIQIENIYFNVYSNQQPSEPKDGPVS